MTVRFYRSFPVRANNYARQMIEKTPSSWQVLSIQTYLRSQNSRLPDSVYCPATIFGFDFL